MSEAQVWAVSTTGCAGGGNKVVAAPAGVAPSRAATSDNRNYYVSKAEQMKEFQKDFDVRGFTQDNSAA